MHYISPMEGATFKAKLRRLGVSQSALAWHLSRHGDESTSFTTINRWCNGRHPVPNLAAALIHEWELRPERAAEVMQQYTRDRTVF